MRSHDFHMSPAELLDGKLVRLTDDDGYTVLSNGTVIDGKGGRLERATVLLRGQRVMSVHAGDAAGEVEAARVIDATGCMILPGMIDCHVHFMGNDTTDPVRVHIAPTDDLKLIRSAFEMYQTLASGFTTVRSLGHGEAEHAYALRQAVAEGLVRGPRILTSGWALSQTRGHGDVRGLPYDWVAANRPRSAFADGEWECRRLVRRNFGEGADVVKVYTSSNRTGRPEFTPDELAAIVDEAHRRGRKVAAHAKTYEGVRNAVVAGIDTIEHGTHELHPDLLELMKEKGTVLVPTMATVELLAVDGEQWGATPEQVASARVQLEGRKVVAAAARDLGVAVATGSDVGARANYGRLSARELGLLVESGFSPMEAVIAATSTSAHALGLGDHIGAIEPDKLADLVVVEGDILSDVSILEDRERIRYILQSTVPLTN